MDFPTDNTEKRKAFLDAFLAQTRKLDLMAAYTHPTNRRIARQFLGLKLFGLSYLFFVLARLDLLPLFELHPKLFWGKKIVLPSDRVGAEINYLGGVPEPSLINFLVKRVGNDEIFYDIGANYGFYTLLAAEFVKAGEIHSFEPGNVPFSYFETNTNDVKAPRIFRNHIALAATTSDITFYNVRGMHSQSSAAAEVIDEGNLPNDRTIVHAIALDDYVADHKPPTLIKMDVEGYELNVLRGAQKMLREHGPTIVMEVWGGERGTQFSSPSVEFLYSLGYSAWEILPSGDIRELGQVDLPSITLGDNFVFKKQKPTA